MGLFTTQGEWKSKVEALESDLVSANSDIESLRAELTTAQGELATARESLSTAPDAEALANLTRERDEALAAAAPDRIEAAALAIIGSAEAPEAVAIAINTAASAMLSQHGHEQVETETVVNASATPHLDKFNELKGSEATAYFNQHSADISREQKLSR